MTDQPDQSRSPQAAQQAPSPGIAMLGEERPLRVGTDLVWGAMAARLEGGFLRGISRSGIELLRGIEFVARDEHWGTLPPQASLPQRSEMTCRVSGLFAFARGLLPWHTEINLLPDGLRVTGLARAPTPVHTNRTGLVVLHPLSCAGQPFEIEHSDGTVSQARFPDLIKPTQPAFDIRALRYAASAEAWIELRFEGEIFEMEDQRNWLDASFKTYCRPHALPKPYTIEAGQEIRHSVELRVEQRTTRVILPDLETREKTALPRIGLGIPLDAIDPSVRELDLLKVLAPAYLLIEHDLAKPRNLHAWAAHASTIGARTALDLWASDNQFTPDRIDAFVRTLRDLPEPPEWITLDCDDDDGTSVFQRLSTAISTTGLNIELGAGTRAFFHLLNTARPRHGSFLRWTMNPTVHALDDTTVMQTAESVAWSVRTAASFANGRPLAVGPETLRMRFNPEQQGLSSLPSPIDPRQRGLFAAAWTLAHFAGLLDPSVDRVSFFEPVGPRGVIYRKVDAQQPWFDEQTSPAAFPVFVVLAALSQASGRPATPLHASDTSDPGLIGVSIGGDSPYWLVANTINQTQSCTLPARTTAVLNEQTYADACLHPAGFWDRHATPTTTPLELSAYSIACLWA